MKNRTVVEDLSQLPQDELNALQAQRLEEDTDVRATVAIVSACVWRLGAQVRRTGNLFDRKKIRSRIADVRKSLDRVEAAL